MTSEQMAYLIGVAVGMSLVLYLTHRDEIVKWIERNLDKDDN